RCTGEAIRAGSNTVEATMVARLVEPTGTESAKIATSIVGSDNAMIVTSRLEPIPPKAVPVSRPANVSATVPSTNNATTANRSAIGSTAEAIDTNGATVATTSVVARSTTGAARKIGPVPRGVIGCLRTSLRRSRHG